MQIINELETVQRGVYCGAIGYLGLDGNACFNVAIRTMMLEHGRVHLSAGGAITADSDAEDEYQELWAKAEGMFRALRAVNGGSRGGVEAQRII
jgi:anthranilate/para-aminobenzoate synthase component I